MIRDYLEPEESDGGPTDGEGMTAAACELADRTYYKSWAPLLRNVLIQHHNIPTKAAAIRPVTRSAAISCGRDTG